MFALILTLLVGAAGVATDAYRLFKAEATVQTALDNALLAAGADSATSGTALASLMQKYLVANIPAGEGIELGTATASYNAATKTVTTSVDVTMPTVFMGLVNMPEATIHATSEAIRSQPGPVDLVLALDTTYSMTAKIGGVKKIDTLKAAAKSLVDKVMASPAAKVGVVPFASYVRVDTSYRDAPWIAVPASVSVSVCSVVRPASGCTSVTSTKNCTLDGVATTCTGTTTTCTDYGQNECHNETVPFNFAGCVAARAGYYTSISDPTGHPYPGRGDCFTTMLDLTATKSTVKSKLDALSAGGDTYLPSGLLWAWNLIDSEVPFTTARTKSEMDKLGGKRVVVFMTDGENTTYPDGIYFRTIPSKTSAKQTEVDNDTRTLCKNLKDDGVILYTVAFDVSDTTALSILKGCATDAGKFFNATDTAGLNDAFEKIGASLQPLRLSK